MFWNVTYNPRIASTFFFQKKKNKEKRPNLRGAYLLACPHQPHLHRPRATQLGGWQEYIFVGGQRYPCWNGQHGRISAPMVCIMEPEIIVNGFLFCEKRGTECCYLCCAEPRCHPNLYCRRTSGIITLMWVSRFNLPRISCV